MPNQFTTSRTDTACPVCGTSFRIKPSHAARRVTCSEACRFIWLSGPRLSLEDRFWPKVDKNGPPHPYSPELGQCWLWTASTFPTGYGQFSIGGLGESKAPAHVGAWQIADGNAPGPDDVIGHTCDVRACVRNDTTGIYIVEGVEYERRGHLFLTTTLGNMRDMVAKGRQYLNRAPSAVPKPVHGRDGEAHWKAKLTAVHVAEIRRAYAASEADQKTLAARFGVAQSYVSAIIRRASWKHVP